MKTEDIDKRIGMPDVDAEWAKFESEVIGEKTAPIPFERGENSHKTVWLWSFGIAASIALVCIFLLNRKTEEQQQLAKLETPAALKETIEQPAVREAQPAEKTSASVVAPQKQLAQTDPVRMPKTKESESPVTIHYPSETELALEGKIAGLDIVPTSADLGSGNTMRLIGSEPNSVRLRGTDPNSQQLRGTQRDTILIIVNGTPLPDSLCTMAYFSSHLYQDLYRQGLFADFQSITIYKDENNIKKYGGGAQYGVVTLSTTPDTLCNAYVQQHPKLKKKRRYLEGYVTDENDQPIADAWVSITPSTAGAATDSTGHFALWIPQNQTELLVSCTGYVRVRKALHSDDGKLIIRMRDATTIKDVQIRVRGKTDNEGKPIPVREITTKDIDLHEFDK